MNLGGFRIGGNVLGDAMNNQMALKPAGGTNMIAYIVGTYVVAPGLLALQLRFPMVSCASGGLMGPSPE